MRLRPIAKVLLVALLAGTSLMACGDDDGGQPSGGDGAETPAPAEVGGSELDAIATGLRVSLQADRVEVDGNTIHIYVKQSDGIVAGAGSECVVASRVVPDDATVVVHRDGDETTC